VDKSGVYSDCTSYESQTLAIRLTRPFRVARRFPSPGLKPAPRATRMPRKSRIRPSFKDHFLSPQCQTLGDSQLSHRCEAS
jgi:hypothetical protein